MIRDLCLKTHSRVCIRLLQPFKKNKIKGFFIISIYFFCPFPTIIHPGFSSANRIKVILVSFNKEENNGAAVCDGDNYLNNLHFH